MEDFLPKSRDLFRKFYKDNLTEYTSIMHKAGTDNNIGNWSFYRSDEIIQHIRDIVYNLSRKFGNVEIPEQFISFESLVEAWENFYNFLLNKEELFEDVISYYNEQKKSLPEPFVWAFLIHSDIKTLLKKILKMDEVKRISEKEQRLIPEDAKKFDIAIITALYDTEFEALKKIPGVWIPYSPADDYTTYLKGKIGNKTVLLVTDDKMGMAAAASLSTKVIAKFSPKYLIMAGIAGGVKDKEKNYGDILVARFTWNYDAGKYKYDKTSNKTVFEPSPEQIELLASHVKAINELKSDKILLSTIESGFITPSATDLKPNMPLKVLFGPVASGSAVLADNKKVEKVKRGNRKLIGIDMETFGVLYAAKSFSSSNSTEAISIKSISDFADHQKNDKYRNYAAYTSAQFVYHFILQKLQ